MGSTKEAQHTPNQEVKVEGKMLKLDKRPLLVFRGEPDPNVGYKCGPGVHLEGQVVVQDGNDWKSWARVSMGGSPTASFVEEPAVREIILNFTPASELRF